MSCKINYMNINLGEESYSSLDLASTKLNEKGKEGTWKRCKNKRKES